MSHLSQPQTLAHIRPHNLLILGALLPPHARRVYISGTLVVWLRQHAHDAYQDLLNTLYGRPSFRGLFVVHGVFAGGVEDRYADFAVGVYCLYC
jgi:hypothetical protein